MGPLLSSYIVYPVFFFLLLLFENLVVPIQENKLDGFDLIANLAMRQGGNYGWIKLDWLVRFQELCLSGSGFDMLEYAGVSDLLFFNHIQFIYLARCSSALDNSDAC